MSKQIGHQEDLYSLSQQIRHQEITLQVIASEGHFGPIEEIRSITGIPGEGANNDVISVQMAMELGCRIKPSKYQQLSGINEKLLEVVGTSKVKLRHRGHFGVGPHWINVCVHVIHNLRTDFHRDMLMSWPTLQKLRLV